MKQMKPWSKEEISELIEQAKTKTTTELSIHFKRNVSSISSKCDVLGVYPKKHVRKPDRPKTDVSGLWDLVLYRKLG